MTEKKFESEIRIKIENVDLFLKALGNLQKTLVKSYSVDDHIYLPRKPTSDWNLNLKTMRIRRYFSPSNYSRILFTENRIVRSHSIPIKQSIYPQGKIELFRGETEIAKKLLDSWDFSHYFTIKKREGSLFKMLQYFELYVAIEKIIDIGYYAEIETWGEDIENIEKRILNVLEHFQISLNKVIPNTLPYLVADKLKLLQKNES